MAAAAFLAVLLAPFALDAPDVDAGLDPPLPQAEITHVSMKDITS